MNGTKPQSQRDQNLKDRIALWRDAFRDKRTGIHQTLDDLIWNYAVFRTAIRIVRLANEKREDRPLVNQMLFDMIQSGYWSGLLLGIRRLLDRGGIKGKQGVYSLRSVIKDIEACRPSITRRVYVEWVCDARYDLEVLRQEQWESVQAAARERRASWGDPELMKSEWAHGHFDFLSWTTEENRSPEDLIDPTVFAKIEARLTALDGISDHVSSHVAHAGNKESREGKDLENFNILDAREVLKSLKQVADLVGVWFANEGGAGLAVYQGDQFEGLDQPMVSASDLKVLDEQWAEIDRDVAAWSISPEEL